MEQKSYTLVHKRGKICPLYQTNQKRYNPNSKQPISKPHKYRPNKALISTHYENQPDPSKQNKKPDPTTATEPPFFPATRMATGRPRTVGLGALRRQSLRAYNEPFTPNVVEKDENEAHILRLELPGPKFCIQFLFNEFYFIFLIYNIKK